jgi:hypothetical protein
MSIFRKISDFFKKPSENESSDLKIHEIIGKFVKNNNADMGETLAVDGRRVIIKNSENILSIPIEAVLKNSENILVGDFDREESIKLGKEWEERKDVLKFDEKGMLIK